MKELKIEELNQVNGGGWGLCISLGAALVFIIGFFGGYTNPQKCNG